MPSIETSETGATDNSNPLAKSGSSGASSYISLSPRGPSTSGSIAAEQQGEGAERKKILPRSLLPNGHLFHFGWHIVCIPFKEPDEICRFTFMTLPPPIRGADPGFCSRKVYKMGGDDRCLDRECVVLFTMDSHEHEKETCESTHHDCLHYQLTYGSVTQRNYKAAVEDGVHGWQGDAADGRLCFLSIIHGYKIEGEAGVYSNFAQAQGK